MAIKALYNVFLTAGVTPFSPLSGLRSTVFVSAFAIVNAPSAATRSAHVADPAAGPVAAAGGRAASLEVGRDAER
jgi:hypothetical protein